MRDYLIFILLGYLSGSIMYAWLIPKLFWGVDTKEEGSDHNPGTANAFMLGGTFCGILVLILELAKGFWPVFLAGRRLDPERGLFALVVAAPVIGHAWPFFWKGKNGGKAIAVSFGVLMGLWMEPRPLWLLVFFFLLFSLVLVINPHGTRTVVTYLCLAVCTFLTVELPVIAWATALVSAVVIRRNRQHGEDEKPEVRFLPWRPRRV